jgi:hypothetical protein
MIAVIEVAGAEKRKQKILPKGMPCFFIPTARGTTPHEHTGRVSTARLKIA